MTDDKWALLNSARAEWCSDGVMRRWNAAILELLGLLQLLELLCLSSIIRHPSAGAAPIR